MAETTCDPGTASQSWARGQAVAWIVPECRPGRFWLTLMAVVTSHSPRVASRRTTSEPPQFVASQGNEPDGILLAELNHDEGVVGVLHIAGAQACWNITRSLSPRRFLARHRYG